MPTREALHGKVIIISAPSGAGKGTTIAQLLEEIHPNFFNVSVTTRPMRPGECPGRDYFFVSQEEFDAHIEKGDFLEYERFVGSSYGTLRQPLIEAAKQDRYIFLDIEIKGAHALMTRRWEQSPLFLFLQCDYQERERRLKLRNTESPEKIAARLARGEGEMREAQSLYSPKNLLWSISTPGLSDPAADIRATTDTLLRRIREHERECWW